MGTLSRRRFGGALSATAALPALARVARAETTLRAAITPVYYDAVPILYAQKTGAFSKAGIDLQLGRLPTGAAITAAIAGGSLDVGKSTFVSVISAFARGVPIVAIAPAAVYDSRLPNGALVVVKDSPLHGPGDLVGKTIAVNSLAEPTRPATEVWLQKNGFDKDAAKFIEVPMSAMSAALDAHRVDAVMFTAPVYDEAMATGKYRVLTPVLNEIAPRWLFSAFVAGRDWATANRDSVRRFAGVVEASAAYTNAHRAELVSTVADLVGVPASAYSRMSWPTGGTTLLASEMQPLIDVSAKAGVIPKAFDAHDMIFDAGKA